MGKAPTVSVRDKALSSVLPSTLTYKERVELKGSHAYDYNRLYTCSYSTNTSVWGRLSEDAAVRSHAQQRGSAKSVSKEPQGPGGLSTTRPDTSGYVANNGRSLVMDAAQEAARWEASTARPLASLPRPVIASFRKKWPVEFMAAVRPQAATINQTMRVMGTYSRDRRLAAAIGVTIPNGIATGFHPDIKP